MTGRAAPGMRRSLPRVLRWRAASRRRASQRCRAQAHQCRRWARKTADRVRARVHTELAASYFELGNIPVALEEAKEALRADANYGPAHNVMGLVYAQLKEDRLAEESFRRASRSTRSIPMPTTTTASSCASASARRRE